MNDVDNKEVRAPDIVDFPCTLKNIDLNSGVSIPGAEFEFKLVHASWGSTDTLICNELGVANFIFPSADSYTIRQTKSSNGYALFPDQIEIDVPMRGMPELRAPINNNSVDYAEDSSGWVLTVKNIKQPIEPQPGPEKPDPQPADTIELSLKNTNEKGDLLRGAEFKLISPNAEERVINWDNIPLGSSPILRLNMQGEWKLEQAKAPLGYQFIPAPLLIRFAGAKVMVDGDEASDWFDYDSASKTLTIKNTPIQSPSEGGTKMKVATDNSLKELIKLVKSQPSTSSGGILNVTLDYTIPSYSPVEVETKRKRVYADIPCVNSKVAMNAQITPNDNIENMSLLTYAEPFDGYIRCYFSEQPTEAYIIDSVELTPVTSIVKKK